MTIEQLCLIQASAVCAVSSICRRWSRVLLLQQLLTDAMDLVDPTYVRVPKARRTRLMPVQYGPLPALSEYQRKLRVSCHPITTSVCNTLAVTATCACDCISNMRNCSLATGFGHSWIRCAVTLAAYSYFGSLQYFCSIVKPVRPRLTVSNLPFETAFVFACRGWPDQAPLGSTAAF